MRTRSQFYMETSSHIFPRNYEASLIPRSLRESLGMRLLLDTVQGSQCSCACKSTNKLQWPDIDLIDYLCNYT